MKTKNLIKKYVKSIIFKSYMLGYEVSYPEKQLFKKRIKFYLKEGYLKRSDLK